MPKKALKKIIHNFTDEEVKETALVTHSRNYGVDKNLKELALQMTDITPGEKASDEVTKNLQAVSRAYSLESGHMLMESVEIEYHQLALQMKIDLEKEFNCKTPSEQALTDQVVISYIRKLTFSRHLEEHKAQRVLSHERNGYLNFISKEVDRAHRQFLSALETLKAIKQPPFKVNVKTQNAFIAENQQFNQHSKENNETK